MLGEKDLRLALDIVTQGSQAKVPKVMAEEQFMAESAKIQTRSKDWTVGRGIQGLGVAEKVTQGKKVKELALKVYVEKKLPKSKVRNLVPSTLMIPEVGSVSTDVEEIGKLQETLFTSKVRPSMPGCGVGHTSTTVGTFGCLVRKKGDKKNLFILSNSHVLANYGLAKIGDTIVQPGPLDGGTKSGDRIGKLAEFVPFEFTPKGFPNLVDAAIAKVISKKAIKVIRILGVPPAGVRTSIRRGLEIHKVGRTTDYTVGVIRDVDFRLSMRYKKTKKSKARLGFRDQVLCTRYTDGGDSGSIVLDRQNRVVGLHFAGSDSASVFNRIKNVMELLKIEVLT